MKNLSSAMRAAHRTQYCGPKQLKVVEIPVPKPGANEILVRVEATTVSRSDVGILTGKPFVIQFFTGLFKPKRAVTGSDFAGRVVQVGAGVTRFNPGDRVWGFNDTGLGSHAQYLCVSVRESIAPIPSGLGFAEAVACAEGAHYAYNFLRKMEINKNSHVLVNGATGAIGSAAVQLLKYAGAKVTAVCGTAHLGRVKELGADQVIDYTASDFTQSGERYHAVFDAVGKRTFAACRNLLLPGGIYVSSELGPWGQNIPLSIAGAFTRGRRVKFPFPYDIPRSMAHVQAAVEAGAFKPLIDRSYSLDQISEAFSYTASGQKIGNVIVTYD